MNIYRKILIILLVFLFLWILYSLYKKREGFQENQSNIDSAAAAELQSVRKNNTTTLSINSVSSNSQKYAINQYVIKGSQNSALSGTYVNLQMIHYVLSRGCRFLDFEIYCLSDNKVYVAYYDGGADPTLDPIQITTNKILLADVITTILNGAFTTSISPNSSDPVFVQLRVSNNEEYNELNGITDQMIYQKIANVIYASVSSTNNMSVLYNGKITSKTPLSKLMGKIIFIMDKTHNLNYASIGGCETVSSSCVDLNSIVNYDSMTESNGQTTISKTSYKNLIKMANTITTFDDNGITVNSKSLSWQLVLNDKANEDSYKIIRNYGAQIFLCRFDINDSFSPGNLANYEGIFNYYSSAYVPLGNAIRYIQRQSSDAPTLIHS
jgi:hypothetical protein